MNIPLRLYIVLLVSLFSNLKCEACRVSTIKEYFLKHFPDDYDKVSTFKNEFYSFVVNGVRIAAIYGKKGKLFMKVKKGSPSVLNRYLNGGLVLLLIIVAVGLRCVAAFQSPHSLSLGPSFEPSNLGIIGLMAKHLLEKGEFPFFLWGQGWFGGLAAFLHAGAFFVFGVSVWAMRVVPLALYSLFCLLTFLIARNLYNRPVAFLSLLWCVVAPTYLTQLSLVPQTYYMELLVLGNLMLWVAIQLTKSESKSRRRLMYGLLGMIGGLGLWANPMIIYYLLGTAVFLLLKERWRAISNGLLYSVPGFLLGSFPLIFYYLHNPFPDATHLETVWSTSNFALGFWRFLLLSGPDLLDIFECKKMCLWSAWGFVFFFAYILVHQCRISGKSLINLFTRRSDSKDAKSLMLFLLFAIIIIYAPSQWMMHFAPRYVSAIYSFFPVACGAAVWEVSRRRRWITIPLFSAYLIVQGFLLWNWASKEIPGYERKTQDVVKLIDFLKSKNISRVYASYHLGAYEMTFLSKEGIVFSDPKQERYPAYKRMLDSSQNPAFIGESEEALSPILKFIGGHCKSEQIGRFWVFYDFEPPRGEYRQIDAHRVKAIASHQSDGMKYSLDRDMTTAWDCGKVRSEDMWVQYDLGKVRKIGMIRLWNSIERHSGYVKDVSVDVSIDGLKWMPVINRTAGDFFYWTGSRISYLDADYHWEARFDPVEARFIHINQYEKSRKSWKLGETYIYEYLGERGVSLESEKKLLDLIQKADLRRIYADPWMSARVREMSLGGIKTIERLADSDVLPKMLKNDRNVIWEDKVGFVLNKADANIFERMAKKEGHHLKRFDEDLWVLFYFENWGEEEELLKEDPGFYWTGFGLVKSDKKAISDYYGKVGTQLKKKGKLKEAFRCYRKALALYQNNQEARIALILVLNELNRSDEASRQEKILEKQMHPKHESYIEFDNGAIFLGYTSSSGHAKAGKKIEMTYYWKFEKDPGQRTGVFVHFEGKSILTQGDHVLLDRHKDGVWPALKNEIFSQTESVVIPQNVLPGKYTIGIGLFSLENGKRWPVKKTVLEVHRNKVLIGTLNVD